MGWKGRRAWPDDHPDLKALTPAMVVVLDTPADRLVFAKELGADETLTVQSKVREMTGGRGAERGAGHRRHQSHVTNGRGDGQEDRAHHHGRSRRRDPSVQ